MSDDIGNHDTKPFELNGVTYQFPFCQDHEPSDPFRAMWGYGMVIEISGRRLAVGVAGPPTQRYGPFVAGDDVTVSYSGAVSLNGRPLSARGESHS